MNERMPHLVTLIEREQERALSGDRIQRLRASVLSSAYAASCARERERDRMRNADENSTGRDGWRIRFNLLASAAIGAALAVVAITLWPARALTFRVAGRGEGSIPIGAWIEVDPRAGQAGVPVWFSDGTVLGLEPGTRMKVDQVGAYGADVVITQGAAHVAVAHLPKARWMLRVGPFDVRVTGTRFDVGWEPEAGQFSLSLEEGSVVVSGGCLSHELALTKGNTLRTRCTTAPSTADSIMVMGNQSGQLPPPGSLIPVQESGSKQSPARFEPRAVLQVAAEPSQLTDNASKPATGLGATNRELPDAASSTEPRAPTSLGAPTAIALPISTQAMQHPEVARELLESATRARLGGNRAAAENTLLALRARFGRSPEAAVAAFDLGVIACDMGGDLSRAVEWFEVYLREAPSGPLRREALGRIIEATKRAQAPRRAQSAAERYLHEFPDGPHAELARELLR